MPTSVGVSFKRVGRCYWFSLGDISPDDLPEWTEVVVETQRGLEVGRVRMTACEVDESELQAPLKPIMRIASDTDRQRERENKQAAATALESCKDRVSKHNLPMKLVRAEYTFDRSQLTFFFVADNRVDFRELVRDLAATFRTRIQLLQIGPRDQAKMLGGMGLCGRGLCCATFLSDFLPISMKMAKDQNLFLNPVKFSGICGKLLCCLKYEHETYCGMRKGMPKVGQAITTPQGDGIVQDINILKHQALVVRGSEQPSWYDCTELNWSCTGECDSHDDMDEEAYERHADL